MVEGSLKQLKLALSDQNLELLPDYESRVEVLKELQFIDENATVLLKGRVACEINSAHELILTELILDNILADYTPEEAVALLSVFVFVEKTESEPAIPAKLAEGLDTIYRIADNVENCQLRRHVAFEDFREKFKPGLVEVVYEWAKGMVRGDVTNNSDHTAVQRHHQPHRRAGGHDCALHHAPRRNVSRGPGRGARYWRRRALPEDGGGAGPHQARQWV